MQRLRWIEIGKEHDTMSSTTNKIVTVLREFGNYDTSSTPIFETLFIVVPRIIGRLHIDTNNEQRSCICQGCLIIEHINERLFVNIIKFMLQQSQFNLLKMMAMPDNKFIYETLLLVIRLLVSALKRKAGSE